MYWIYVIATGCLYDPGGKFAGCGYSGRPAYEYNPSATKLCDAGPIPTGVWYIGSARDEPHLGPVSMPLTPSSEADTFGRFGFWIHGANPQHPLNSSCGCIVLPETTRIRISKSAVRRLMVVAEPIFGQDQMRCNFETQSTTKIAA